MRDTPMDYLFEEEKFTEQKFRENASLEEGVSGCEEIYTEYGENEASVDKVNRPRSDMQR